MALSLDEFTQHAQKLFAYEAESGDVVWTSHPTTPSKIGLKVGHVTQISGKQYLYVRVHGHKFPLHRVILLIVNNEWPRGTVDHIDGNGINNRLCNLRIVSHGENLKNKRRQSNNISGVTGVSFSQKRKRWVVQINTSPGIKTYVGSFLTLDEAIVARRTAQKTFGYHKNHGSDRPL